MCRLLIGFVLALLAPACGSSERNGSSVELTLYAATSLRDALRSLAPGYEKGSGVRLVFNFGSSGDLSRQIVAANGADLFFSADEAELDRVAAAGLLAPGSRRSLLSNQLVVIEPADASVFRQPFALEQLAGEDVELLSLANTDTVPAGKYARALLEKAGLWEALKSRVLPGVDVRAALAAVESGAAQAGIVYRTDAARSTRVRVLLAVPVEDGPPISYPVAVLSGRPHPDEARALLAFLASDEARAVYERFGFVVLDD